MDADPPPQGVTFPRRITSDTEALDNLLKTTPETLAGARAAIAWLVKVDDGSVPERSGKYMETLLRSPVFAA